ncbi:hypothetical protein CCR97_04220 [Rhodoplanes elegans]|uniref:Uncharacterized protein n=1 Tax=Rhodoplanes elegans TaxID=29408 RepID=A0A327KFA5_9BRAD|nr:hypothetical protein [Rhodoplanes elegans]MBK5957415.1 hypothetical protein [Rhodoplanes elegans]RAI37470.1 hypothetical protein CH338_15950 [Rhodoplanes elegans]
MRVLLGGEEFPESVLTDPDHVVMRLFLDRARARTDAPAKTLIERWRHDLAVKRRNLRNRRG